MNTTVTVRGTSHNTMGALSNISFSDLAVIRGINSTIGQHLGVLGFVQLFVHYGRDIQLVLQAATIANVAATCPDCESFY